MAAKQPGRRSRPVGSVDPLLRIADALELLLKLQLLLLPPHLATDLEGLREAEFERLEPQVKAPAAKRPTKPEILNQSAEELELLSGLAPGSDEEADYDQQARAGAGLEARMAALRGEGGAGLR